MTEDRFRGRSCSGGLDLASVSDLCSLVWVFPCARVPGAADILHRSFVPEAQLDPKRNPRRWPQYRSWAAAGWLLVTPGEAVDYGFIRARVLEDASRFRVLSLAVDRLFQGQQLCLELQDEGVNLFAFGQGFYSMAPAVQTFERRLLARQLHHGGDPVLRWSVSNAVTRRDPAGNQKIDKEKSAEKVDPVVALVMALDRASRDVAPPAPRQRGVAKLWRGPSRGFEAI
jgi:phage terminase large subunit-like protein